ncbi:hypothetical protein WJU70_004672 [Enterobacter cloacae]|uniref:hypothetical protein n=1 Tax=Enterobacter cloacae TaxID=550 RepID=UPI001A1F1103|nr:hypothetical protein [Enterobacter cloacae]EGQ7345380.1 hypothetical protein [Enterobacter cloacae]ELK7548413.1 hypothetical protein [Enterobacter cloacae]ELK7550486.1 hypothetical protein [Enterobacter cloacae]HAZ4813968.1 hypothetical protein [Enterobacter cloacae]
MNRQQKEQVLGLLDAFDAINFNDKVAESFKESGDISQVMLGDINVYDYVTLVNKVRNHFRQEFDDLNYVTLPFSYNYGSEIGSGNLLSDLSNMNANISGANYSNSLAFVYRLANYQRVNGFWELNTRRAFKKTERKLQEEYELLEMKKSLIEQRILELDNFVKRVEDAEVSVSTFLDECQSQVKNYEALLQNLVSQNDSINNMFNSTTSVVEKINSQLALSENKNNSIDKIFDDSEKALNAIKLNISQYKDEYSEISKKLIALNSSFDEKLAFVADKESYFKERNDYLDALIGREVGASLFETFKQRKNELAPSVNFWKYAVPFLAVSTVLWIFFLFHLSEGQTMDYKLIIINSIKALPAIGLLLFGIAQYSKERNFQEEYAFKSAVALTLKAYAEQLISEENKDALILSSVSSIYKSPIYHSKLKVEDGKSAIDSVSDLLGKFKDINLTKK